MAGDVLKNVLSDCFSISRILLIQRLRYSCVKAIVQEIRIAPLTFFKMYFLCRPPTGYDTIDTCNQKLEIKKTSDNIVYVNVKGS